MAHVNPFPSPVGWIPLCTWISASWNYSSEGLEGPLYFQKSPKVLIVKTSLIPIYLCLCFLTQDGVKFGNFDLRHFLLIPSSLRKEEKNNFWPEDFCPCIAVNFSCTCPCTSACLHMHMSLCVCFAPTAAVHGCPQLFAWIRSVLSRDKHIVSPPHYAVRNNNNN